MPIKPIGYAEFLRIFNTPPKEPFDGFRIEPDGLYVDPKAYDDANLFPEEISALTWHPTGKYDEPALPLPCSADDLRHFVRIAGMTGYIDEEILAETAATKREEAAGFGSPGRSAAAAVIRKRAALIADVVGFWPSIEIDLSDSRRNGLHAAAKLRSKHGFWIVEPALNWAKERGKILEKKAQAFVASSDRNELTFLLSNLLKQN